ncbi:uncharacterized protein LOC111711780, partial [Eurytemora carolleeae]|uniref:uncharacterized protein LOC111711780 n=1 Tax=Eurytemora carolleeae TaxID=1294199 RepID=UPI000C75BD99
MNELKKYFTFGGGETRELTCFKAADRFVKNDLSKNVESENVRFPEHIIRLGTTPEGPKLSPQELKAMADNMTDPKEKGNLKQWIGHRRGAECERLVWDYLMRTPESVRSSLFYGFKREMFLRFTTNDPTHNKQKEYDFILMLPEYKLMLFLEVKADPGGNSKSWEEQMRKAKNDLFKELLEYVGEDTNTTEWTFLPVGVYPNVSQQFRASQQFQQDYPKHLILTKSEIESTSENIMTEVTKLFQKPGFNLETFPVDETYCNMAKILLAAAYSGKANATLSLAPYNFVAESNKLLLGNNVGAIGVGMDP